MFQAKSWEAKLEKANSMVPTIILENASTEFLDLHYVYVSEALEVSHPVILIVIPILNSFQNRYWTFFWTGMFNDGSIILLWAQKWSR